jgi:hypothetical protein
MRVLSWRVATRQWVLYGAAAEDPDCLYDPDKEISERLCEGVVLSPARDEMRASRDRRENEGNSVSNSSLVLFLQC